MIDTINLIKSFLCQNASYKEGADYYELTKLFQHLQNLIEYDQDQLYKFQDLAIKCENRENIKELIAKVSLLEQEIKSIHYKINNLAHKL